MQKNYDHQRIEKKWQKFWDKEKLFKFNEKNKTKPIFSIDTPPPYVSADHLHAGHVMSYAQAEFIARYKRMKGFNVYYPMGFDDNGLPTERFVEKKYNINKAKISREDFVKLCLKETRLGAKTYHQLWNKLGISVDWSKTYSTIDKRSRKISQWSFIDLYRKKLIYQARKPIMWCVACQTAISQADLEDREEKTFLNYIEFGPKLLIATTRPELLEACSALFHHPDDERYQGLKKATVPVFNYDVPILTDESVDPKFGTGLMMVCTWGDVEDIKKWEKHKLKARPLIKPNQLINIEDLRKESIKKLKTAGVLSKQEEITHTINIHERCSTPIEFLETKQWFIDLLAHKKELLIQGRKLTWHPVFMKQRYTDWINGLRWDWCISRQRYYGVPFPVWYCDSCQKITLAKEKDLPVDPSETKKICPKCGEKTRGEVDVMDTWMTSSLSPIIASKLSKKRKKDLYPMTLRPQAFEIIRTWLFYTVVKSYYHHQKLPFAETMISGHGLDQKGQKISKRLGNYRNPDEIIKEYGADALRYWATGARLGHNMRYNEKEIQKGKRTVTKLWNIARFSSIHLKNFKPPKNLNPSDVVDKWILSELRKTAKIASREFNNYEYSKARSAIDDFLWNKFADNYLEFIKHRLYEDNDPEAKATLYQVLLDTIKLYAPILPHVTEEIFSLCFKKQEKVKSLHLALWPEEKTDLKTPPDFKNFLETIEEIRKYKSQNQISIGQEIDKYKLRDKKYAEEIKRIMKIKTII